jgi:hypothetical protein
LPVLATVLSIYSQPPLAVNLKAFAILFIFY